MTADRLPDDSSVAVRHNWGPGEWTPERHQQVAAQLDYVAAAYEWKARPFRDRADQHRRAAQGQE